MSIIYYANHQDSARGYAREFTINYRKYSYSYSVWAWLTADGSQAVINGIKNFFQTLKNDKIIDYEVIENQAYFSTNYSDNDPDSGGGFDGYYIDLDRRIDGRDYVRDLLRSVPTRGWGTVLRYKALAGSLRIHWQGIPIKDNAYIIFGIYYENSSMCFTRADNNSSYVMGPTHHRGQYKTFTLAPYKQQ